MIRWLCLALLLTACGGTPPDDEVPAVWTAGDDAPLEEAAPAEEEP